MASKKVRFEVFKRDKFQCQYCGKTPPSVVLELDHINPKSKGGKDDINNYITACFECNRGKRDNPLTELPPATNILLKDLKEKRLQLTEYNKYLEAAYDEADKSIFDINNELNSYCHKTFTKQFCDGTIRRFLKHLPKHKIIETIAIAFDKHPIIEGLSDKPFISYFCGICWNWIKNPETRDW